jgi:cytochrome c oxidase subunit 3/cytochrome o ubiquinol oxidase subunit 3
MEAVLHNPETWRPARGKVGMASLIAMESFFFAGFIVAYLFYIGKSAVGPYPREVLELRPVLWNSAALIGSSFTIMAAVRGLARGQMGGMRFWLLVTMLLGGWFLWGTWVEWRGLIWERGLTIRTNLFGTTFYSLVGFHAFHVTVGLLALLAFWVLAMLGRLKPARDTIRFELVSWYWHFVDVVWIFVFTSVYIVGMRA